MWIISAVSLSIIMLGCVFGVFLPRKYFDDNLAQCIGMSGLFIFAWPRFVQIMERQELSSATMPIYAQLCGHVGLALYTLGTAYKVWRNRPN